MKTGNHKNTYFNIYVDNKGMKLTVSRRMAKLLTVSRESPTPLETSINYNLVIKGNSRKK